MHKQQYRQNTCHGAENEVRTKCKPTAQEQNVPRYTNERSSRKKLYWTWTRTNSWNHGATMSIMAWLVTIQSHEGREQHEHGFVLHASNSFETHAATEPLLGMKQNIFEGEKGELSKFSEQEFFFNVTLWRLASFVSFAWPTLCDILFCLLVIAQAPAPWRLAKSTF